MQKEMKENQLRWAIVQLIAKDDIYQFFTDKLNVNSKEVEPKYTRDEVKGSILDLFLMPSTPSNPELIDRMGDVLIAEAMLSQ